MRKAVSAARAGPLFDILCRRESLAQVRSGGKQADWLITLLGWFRHMSLNPLACSAFGKAVLFPGEVARETGAEFPCAGTRQPGIAAGFIDRPSIGEHLNYTFMTAAACTS